MRMTAATTRTARCTLGTTPGFVNPGRAPLAFVGSAEPREPACEQLAQLREGKARCADEVRARSTSAAAPENTYLEIL
jgi:hypothetical protein